MPFWPEYYYMYVRKIPGKGYSTYADSLNCISEKAFLPVSFLCSHLSHEEEGLEGRRISHAI